MKEDDAEGGQSAKTEGRCFSFAFLSDCGRWELAAPGHPTTNVKYTLNVFFSPGSGCGVWPCSSCRDLAALA